MKVKNMISKSGNPVANQFILWDQDLDFDYVVFQSYDSTIVKTVTSQLTGKKRVFLDRHYWDYSVTTGKYRNQFLGETKKETQAKIDSGEYILADLN